MIETDRFEKIEVTSSSDLRQWLLMNYGQKQSFWLITYLKKVSEKYVSTDQVLDELISFGWIDGIRRKLDDTRTMQLISPRKVQHWTKSYKDRAARLIQEEKMHEAGYQSIAQSKLAGLWDFMDDVDQLIVPPDLKAELEKQNGASEYFNALNPSSKRFVLRWLKLSKTETTRKVRIKELAELSAQGKKVKGS